MSGSGTVSTDRMRCPCCWAAPACEDFSMRVPKVLYWNLFGTGTYTCTPSSGSGCICSNTDHNNNFSSGISFPLIYRKIETPETIDFGTVHGGCPGPIVTTGPFRLIDYTGDIWEHRSGPYVVNGFSGGGATTYLDCTYYIYAYMTPGGGSWEGPDCMFYDPDNPFTPYCKLLLMMRMMSAAPDVYAGEQRSQPCCGYLSANGDTDLTSFLHITPIPLTNSLFPNANPFSSVTIPITFNQYGIIVSCLCSDCATNGTCGIDSIITE